MLSTLQIFPCVPPFPCIDNASLDINQEQSSARDLAVFRADGGDELSSRGGDQSTTVAGVCGVSPGVKASSSRSTNACSSACSFVRSFLRTCQKSKSGVKSTDGFPQLH